METRTDLTEFTHKMDEIRQHIADIIVGQTKAVDMILTSIIADGHVLLEGVPGVAKPCLHDWCHDSSTHGSHAYSLPPTSCQAMFLAHPFST